MRHRRRNGGSDKDLVPGRHSRPPRCRDYRRRRADRGQVRSQPQEAQPRRVHSSELSFDKVRCSIISIGRSQTKRFCMTRRTIRCIVREANRCHELTSKRGRKNEGRKVKRTISQSKSCEACPLWAKCRGKGGPFKNGRRMMPDEFEEIRSQHREKMSTPGAKTRYQGRFSPGERPFS